MTEDSSKIGFTRSWEDRIKFYTQDAKKIVPLIIVGFIFIIGGLPLAQHTGLDFLAPWGLFLGGCFWAAALSHVLRRTLFPWLNLQVLTDKALENPIGAAIVFLGVCVVLASFIALTGAMLRT